MTRDWALLDTIDFVEYLRDYPEALTSVGRKRLQRATKRGMSSALFVYAYLRFVRHTATRHERRSLTFLT